MNSDDYEISQEIDDGLALAKKMLRRKRIFIIFGIIGIISVYITAVSLGSGSLLQPGKNIPISTATDAHTLTPATTKTSQPTKTYTLSSTKTLAPPNTPIPTYTPLLSTADYDVDIWNVHITQISNSQVRVDFEYKIAKSLNLSEFVFSPDFPSGSDCAFKGFSFSPLTPRDYTGNTRNENEGISIDWSKGSCQSNYLNISLSQIINQEGSSFGLRDIYTEKFEVPIILSSE